MRVLRRARALVATGSPFRHLLDSLETQSADERAATLVRAGILTPDGKLASKYASAKR